MHPQLQLDPLQTSFLATWPASLLYAHIAQTASLQSSATKKHWVQMGHFAILLGLCIQGRSCSTALYSAESSLRLLGARLEADMLERRGRRTERGGVTITIKLLY